MMVSLEELKPFAQGGNRLCFVHPHDSTRCIKVRRPDFTLVDRRREKDFPKNLRPLSTFDDNREEYLVMLALEKYCGPTIYHCISRCYGFENTDMGKGLCSELIRSGDGRISITLKQYLWDYGLTVPIEKSIADFIDLWSSILIPSRDLLLHNIVVQMSDNRIKRLVVIDGLGAAGVIPFHMMPLRIRERKVWKKIVNLKERIHIFLKQRESGNFPGQHGLLFHDGVTGESVVSDNDEK